MINYTIQDKRVEAGKMATEIICAVINDQGDSVVAEGGFTNNRIDVKAMWDRIFDHIYRRLDPDSMTEEERYQFAKSIVAVHEAESTVLSDE